MPTKFMMTLRLDHAVTGNARLDVKVFTMGLPKEYDDLLKHLDIYRILYLSENMRGADVDLFLFKALLESCSKKNELMRVLENTGKSISDREKVCSNFIEFLGSLLEGVNRYPQAYIDREVYSVGVDTANFKI